jgi:biotin-dependent carboxylase-like uncharacterized protein
VIEVLHPGALSTIQDLGRPGFAHLGIPRSGAADRVSLRFANLLVGNREGAAAIETTLVGPRLRLLADTTIALTGAAVLAKCMAGETAMNTPIHLRAGDELDVGNATSGLRTYIAVAGGIDVAPVLGSASTDLLTGLGPPTLRAGDRLAIGGPSATPPRDLPRIPDPGEVGTRLGVVLGPRSDWFSPDSLRAFLSSEFQLTPASNRVGLRLFGPELRRIDHRELASEGLVHGAIQVPGNGQPIILGVDHPTTGGYPVIAVVISDALPTLGQLRPGQQIRFVAVEAP